MAGQCALVMHPDCGRHDTGWGHPEHQGRLPAVVKAIERATPLLQDAVQPVDAKPAPVSSLQRVHTDVHIDRVRALVAEAHDTNGLVVVGGDTVVSAASWDAALAAAGCALDAVAAVARGDARTAFALCRPPGHHATADRIMGFCLFNNVAIAARALQHEHGAARVLIIDWDVHHGNGTQDVFYDDASVCYLSVHQSPWYPGSGDAGERGRGEGLGTTHNVPLPAGTSAAAYRRAFEAALDRALGAFTPDAVLVSAGFDCMAGDPLGGFLLEPADLYALSRTVLARAEGVCGGRVAAVLEGGYAPARVGAGVVAVLRAFAGLDWDGEAA